MSRSQEAKGFLNYCSPSLEAIENFGILIKDIPNFLNICLFFAPFLSHMETDSSLSFATRESAFEDLHRASTRLKMFFVHERK